MRHTQTNEEYFIAYHLILPENVIKYKPSQANTTPIRSHLTIQTTTIPAERFGATKETHIPKNTEEDAESCLRSIFQEASYKNKGIPSKIITKRLEL